MTQILPILQRRSFVQTLQGQAFKYNLCFYSYEHTTFSNYEDF